MSTTCQQAAIYNNNNENTKNKQDKPKPTKNIIFFRCKFPLRIFFFNDYLGKNGSKLIDIVLN